MNGINKCNHQTTQTPQLFRKKTVLLRIPLIPGARRNFQRARTRANARCDVFLQICDVFQSECMFILPSNVSPEGRHAECGTITETRRIMDIPVAFLYPLLARFLLSDPHNPLRVKGQELRHLALCCYRKRINSEVAPWSRNHKPHLLKCFIPSYSAGIATTDTGYIFIHLW